MAYTALYRKWRPQTFSEVKGQDAIIQTLRNQVKLGRVGHAYLFCGSRGTGKTSVAKIFSRAVNCENPSDGEPCGQCAMCRAAAAGSSMNVFELDAASNNGVENVRELLSEIQYPPTEGKYRVYIVDEVHMFSTSAFNAFLKTLEEPPEYVIFILATTEPHKIPATIISRCQQYDFKRIDGATIQDRLKQLCAGEGVTYEDRALSYIARKADGGMRDAISLLDQATAGAGRELTYDAVLAALGAVDTEIFGRFAAGLASHDAPGLLAMIEEITMSGREIGQFTQDLIWYFRNMLLMKSAPDQTDIIDVSDEDRKILAANADSFSAEELMWLIRLYSSCFNDMRQAVNKRVLCEVATLRAINPDTQKDMDSVYARLGRLEAMLQSGEVSMRAQTPAKIQAPAQEKIPAPAPGEAASQPAEESPHPAPEKPEAAPIAEPEPVLQPEQQPAGDFDWQAIVSSVNPLLKNYLGKAQPVISGDVLELHFADQFDFDGAKRFAAADVLSQIISDRYGRKLTIIGKVGQPAADSAEEDLKNKIEDIFRFKIDEV